jgi:hypothetical protein
MAMRNGTVAARPQASVDRESCAVHAWRVNQLTRLGLSQAAAEAVADKVDWHEVARLVQRGCPAALAVSIIQ